MNNSHLSSEGQLLLLLAGPNVKQLVEWLERHRNKYEVIDIHSWVGRLWYILITDTRIDKSPDDALIGFTVDLINDHIFLPNDTRYAKEGYTRGGNCFLRSERWFRLLRKQYPSLVITKIERQTQVFDYRHRRQRKKVA